MRSHHGPHTRSAIQARRRAAHDQPRRRRASAQLISDAVTASYIHDISTRHGGGVGVIGDSWTALRRSTPGVGDRAV
ncbi:MAG: hypothetical protein ACJ764_08185 [Solirubrobacteraceae bacterium]